MSPFEAATARDLKKTRDEKELFLLRLQLELVDGIVREKREHKQQREAERDDPDTAHDASACLVPLPCGSSSRLPA